MTRKQMMIMAAAALVLSFLTIAAPYESKLRTADGYQKDGSDWWTAMLSNQNPDRPRSGHLSKEALEARQRWYDSGSWKRAEGLFDSGSLEPLLLVDNEDRKRGLVYLENKTVYLLFADERGIFRQEALITIDQPAARAKLWRNGDSLLLGVQLPFRDYPRGQWYSIEQTAAHAPLFIVTPIERLHFGPEQVLTMTLSENPQLFLVTASNGTGFSEYLYKPGGAKFMSVNLTLANDREPEVDSNYLLRKPSPQTSTLSFKRQQQFQLPQMGTVSTFEDERGTIVYYHEGEQRFISRFVDHVASDFRLFEDTLGNKHILGYFQAPHGKGVLSFLTGGYYSYFDYNPLLFQDGWNMYNLYNFYKISEQQIELVHYEYDWETNKAIDTYWTYPLNGARFTGRSGDWLHFERNGKPFVLSAYDLVHYRSANRTANNRLDDLWIRQVDITWRDTPTAGGSEPAQVKLQVPQSLWRNDDSYARFPQQVQEALNKMCAFGCGDYFSPPVVRHIDDQWLVLIRETMYEIQEGEPIELAKLPLTIAHSVYYEKASSSITAQDFAKKDGNWYVADTFGSRILKLDDQFRIVKQHPLPFPTTIDTGKPNTLQVVSMSGITVLSDDLQPIGESVPVPETAVPLEEIEWPGESCYADPETGHTWIHFNGHLLVFGPGSEQYQSYYTGYNWNASFRTKLIPYGDDLIVLMDEKALIFGRDGGWKRNLTFPRAQPDGVYMYHLSGEGSYQIDTANKKLYLVQGYRIIGIDLVSGRYAELFRQNIATIGNILLNDNNLIFTLHRGDLYDEKIKRTNQLVVLDLATGHVTRYGMESGMVTSRIIDGDKVEFFVPVPGGDSSQDTPRIRSFPLQQLQKIVAELTPASVQ